MGARYGCMLSLFRSLVGNFQIARKFIRKKIFDLLENWAKVRYLLPGNGSRKLAHRNVSLIPLQFGEIIVEALEEGFPQPVGARSAARPLQIRSFRQRGELVSHLHRVFQIPVMQKVVVAPDLFLLRVRVAPKNVQQRDVVSLG